MKKVNRYIAVFNKYVKSEEDEYILGKINIDHISLNILQDIFKPDSDDYDYMYDEYHITETNARTLEKYLSVNLDLEKFSYTVSCTAIE